MIMTGGRTRALRQGQKHPYLVRRLLYMCPSMLAMLQLDRSIVVYIHHHGAHMRNVAKVKSSLHHFWSTSETQVSLQVASRA